MTREERFSFPSADGKTMIDAVKWIPEDGKYHAILQISHGMIEYIDRYKCFAEFLNENGYLVVGHNHLGHGTSVVSEDNWGYFADKDSPNVLIADMHTLRTMVQRENEGVPYFMLGHSMGSYLLRRYLTVYNDNLRGAIIVGTGCVEDNLSKLGKNLCRLMAMFFGWHHRSKLVQSLTFSGPYKKFDMDGTNPENSWLTRDVGIVKQYYNDPRCTFCFTLNGYHMLMDTVHYDNQMENIGKTPKKLPIFIVSGQDDPVGDMGEGVKKVYYKYEKAGMKDITYKLYENDRHELLNELDKDVVFADILSWMEVHITT